MKNKTKNLLQIIGIIALFSAIWIFGVLIYGEWVTADTAYFGSILGKSFEKMFALTPLAVLAVGFILTFIAKKKNSKSIFITTEIMLLLPFVAYILAASLISLSNALNGISVIAIIGCVFLVIASPCMTWLSCMGDIFSNSAVYIILLPAIYLIISLLNILFFKFKKYHGNPNSSRLNKPSSAVRS